MQPAAASEIDPAFTVAPPLRVSVPWRVLTADTLPGWRLRVTFMDGTVGEADMSRFVTTARVEGTPFEPLRDPAFFEQARVTLGVVSWPNGADLAPDAMYDAIRQDGRWVPG
jgi:hypothetical protein